MEHGRVYNFSAGPCCLPLEVLKKAQEDMLNYAGTGMSIMEISHRNKEYTKIWNNARNGFRKLLGIPDNYQVFFMQGGASLQFSAIPMNFLDGKSEANFLPTGYPASLIS
jgi:phosphoserine aminotransferase